ncbi:hypothetical protein EV714DRAFT_246964 [Schizophyllum commune]
MAPRRFVTQTAHKDAISLASSLAFNSGNREAPWYGVQSRYLSDLLSATMTLFPQYRIDLHSSLWKKPLKASSAPNSAAPASAPTSTAAPPAAPDPVSTIPDSSTADASEPEVVDLHLDDNSDPEELDAMTVDTHETDESEDEQIRARAIAALDSQELQAEAVDEVDASDGSTDDEDEDEDEDEDDGERAVDVDADDEGNWEDVDDDFEGEHGGEQRGAQEDGVDEPEVDEDARASAHTSVPVVHGPQLRSRANRAQASDQTAADETDTSSPVRRTSHQYTSPFPDDKSDTSRKTDKDKKGFHRKPDFCITHTISANMRSTPANGEDAELHAVRYEIHCGRQTQHRCIILIEEDKRAPSRKLTGRQRAIEVKGELSSATFQLITYMSAYFYAVPHSPGVIGRVTSGIYWKWLLVKPKDVPKYDPIAREPRRDPPNETLHDLLIKQYSNAPTYYLGSNISDTALNDMRTRLYTLARDCTNAHENK